MIVSVTQPFSARILEMLKKKETENAREASKVMARLIRLPSSVRLISW